MNDTLHLLEGSAAAQANPQPVGFAQALAGSTRGLDTVFDSGNAPVIDELFSAAYLYGGDAVTVGHGPDFLILLEARR
jgi:hypothetical protein